MKILEKESGKFHVSADIGCHLFSIFPPFNIGATTMGYGLGAAGEFEGEHGAELAHLPLGEFVLRVRRETGVVHGPHRRVALERLGQELGAAALVAGAHTEGADAAQRVECIERRRCGAVQHAVAPDRVDEVALAAHHAERRVVVPGDALGRGVHRQVHAVRERLLMASLRKVLSTLAANRSPRGHIPSLVHDAHDRGVEAHIGKGLQLVADPERGHHSRRHARTPGMRRPPRAGRGSRSTH